MKNNFFIITHLILRILMVYRVDRRLDVSSDRNLIAVRRVKIEGCRIEVEDLGEKARENQDRALVCDNNDCAKVALRGTL